MELVKWNMSNGTCQMEHGQIMAFANPKQQKCFSGLDFFFFGSVCLSIFIIGPVGRFLLAERSVGRRFSGRVLLITLQIGQAGFILSREKEDFLIIVVSRPEVMDG